MSNTKTFFERGSFEEEARLSSMASLVDCGVQGDYKWRGIAAVGNKLFCAPWDSNLILVIDAQAEAVHTPSAVGEG